MFIPHYYLSSYLVLDSINDSIEKFARNFFWPNGVIKVASILLVGKKSTLAKNEGGLGMHALRHVKKTLMTKNALNYFNCKSIIWVDIG